MTVDGVRVAATDRERADAFAVRWTVFVEGQGVPVDLERDDHDAPDADAVHVVAYDDGRPVGAARLRPVEDGASDGPAGKVERVAVLEGHRDEGWGRRLMAAVEEAARERGFEEVVLHAQTSVEGFYRRLGYRTTSGEFEEAGIPHVEMEKSLSA